jgi:hypothetical protein
MSGGDPEKGKSWAFRSASTLLPIPKSMNTDPQRLRERKLRHPKESPQQGDVIPAAELTLDDAFPNLMRDRTLEIAFIEFRNLVAHLIIPMQCRNRRASDSVAHRALMIRIVSSDRSV